MKKSLAILFALVAFIAALPVKEKKTEQPKEKKLEDPDEDWGMDLEYGRYLKEVIGTLEGDPEFRKRLEAVNPEDIKSGKIAENLDFVHHNVRTKLDEIKRQEIERLRTLTIEQHSRKGELTAASKQAHIDHHDPYKFESVDLKKLISKFSNDLDEADKTRKKEFKSYELEKKYEYEQKMKNANETEKNRLKLKHEEEVTKHKDHPKLHHPGSKPQLEEVWKDQDHLPKEDFNPKVFFQLHDLDGNGYWDELEVDALFKNELDKMYDPNVPEDDMRERIEEMERMREHVFKETDKDGDQLISFDEFMLQTQQNDFDRDEGWQGLDEQDVYSQQEYDRYEQERMDEMQRLVESGAIPPPPGYHGLQPPVPSVAFQSPNEPLAGAQFQGLSHHDNPPLVETNHIAQPNMQHQNDPLAIPERNMGGQQQLHPSQFQQQQQQYQLPQQQHQPPQFQQQQHQPPQFQQQQHQQQPPQLQQQQQHQPPQFQQQQQHHQQQPPQLQQQHQPVQQNQLKPQEKHS